jgi:zinc protease
MEERRQSYDNRPYMRSFLRRDELAYQGYFPYEHSTIGDMADLTAASLRDVRTFHDRYYVPANAVISIAGDFEPAQAMEMVRRHFGMIPAGTASQWTAPEFAAQTAERTEILQDPLARLPAFHVVWHIPARRTPDHYALEVLAAVLGSGESSRLHQDLVKTREIASEINVYTEDRRGPDVMGVWCTLAQNHTGAEARTVIFEHISRIAQEGITAQELDKVKNLVRAQFVFGLQRNLTRAQRLAEYELYDGNASLLRTEADRYLAVTREDVQRVAGQYFSPNNRTVLDVVPAPEAAPHP